MGVEAEGDSLKKGVSGLSNTFTVLTSGFDATKVAVEFEGPSMPELKFENQEDGNVDVSYKVKQAGDYKIHVLYDNEEIEGSPFDCVVSDDEEQYRKIISTIKCSGPNLTAGQCGIKNEIYIDCKEAEIIDSLDFQMEGPGKAEVNFIENKDGTLTVSYIPPKPGDYRLNLKYAEIHLPGSPFTITILN